MFFQISEKSLTKQTLDSTSFGILRLTFLTKINYDLDGQNKPPCIFNYFFVLRKLKQRLKKSKHKDSQDRAL